MLLISIENSYLLLCRFIWKKSCTNWLTLSVINMDLFLTHIFICKCWKKGAKQQVFKNLFTEISVTAISFWSLFQCFCFGLFFQDFPETFPWILSDNIFMPPNFESFQLVGGLIYMFPFLFLLITHQETDSPDHCRLNP